MSNPSTHFRRLLTLTTALTLATPLLSHAQDAAAPAPSAAPPTRVGALAGITGNVSFNGAGSNGQWIAATPNYPISTSDSVFTQAGARATLAVDSSRLTLAENTELQVTSLDQSTLAATESQGEMFLAIDYLQPGQSFAITTPRGTVNIAQNGNYDIAVGDQTAPTIVTVLAGAATVTDPGATIDIAAGQSGVLSGTDQTVAQLGTAVRDPFMNDMLAELAPPPPAYAPPVVRQMTGVTALGSYGSWSQSPTYGAVWYPRVESGWAPYRQGHWAYVAPWGYTWVDNEPWGFAPFHYGRWIDQDDRWGWVPCAAYTQGGSYGSYGGGGGYNPDYAPVYAPAVVSFFGGVGAGVGIGLTINALSSGAVGWVPLAPNEPYYPPYRAPQNYINRINYVNVRNTTVINNVTNNTTIVNNYNNFANRRAATYLPADAMSRGEAVARYGRPAPQAMLAQARPILADYRQGNQAPGAFPGQQPGQQLGHPQGPRPAPGSVPGPAAGPAAGPLALPPPNFQHRPAPPPQLTAFAQRRALPPAIVSHDPAPALRPGQTYTGPVHAGAPGLQAPGFRPAGQPALAQPASGQPALAHPTFGANPGFRPPPPPPGGQAGGGQAGGAQARAPAAFPNGQHPFAPNTPNRPQPGFAAIPAFHPTPVPPSIGQHPTGIGAPARAQMPDVIHPGEPPRPPAVPHVITPQQPQAQPFRPQPPVQQFHPQPLPQQYHPQPPAQQVHPQPQQFQPQPQQFHPQPQPQMPRTQMPEAQMPRPQPQQPTHVEMPQQQFHPAPPPQRAPEPAPRPEPQKHPFPG